MNTVEGLHESSLDDWSRGVREYSPIFQCSAEPDQLRPDLQALGRRPTLIQVCSRTLVRAQQPRGQSYGGVRVWSPRGQLLWLEMVLWLGLTGLMLYVANFCFLWFLPFAAVAGLWPVLATLWKPCCVITDNLGVGTSGASGTLFSAWDDIIGCRIDASRMYVYTTSEETIKVDLFGYCVRDMLEIQDLVLQNAHLTSCPAASGLYLRRSVLPTNVPGALSD